VYGAGARGRAGQARDGVWGALRRGVEAGGGRCERAALERLYGHGGLGWSGRAGSDGGGRVGVGRLVACLGRTRGWLVQVMDLRVHHPR
jgi:hypothetical protein